MINVRIKLLPPSTPDGKPRAVTQKVFLRNGAEHVKGCRPLEPGEVVALEDIEARAALKHLPFELEMTEDKATRPLYFRNLDEANMTSQFFNPSSAGRAEQAKAAMKQMWADAEKPENKEVIEVINELEVREAAIAAREVELGLRDAPELEDTELDDEGYVAENNTMSDGELENVRIAAAAERGDTEVAVAAPAAMEPATPPRQRRRRTATA